MRNYFLLLILIIWGPLAVSQDFGQYRTILDTTTNANIRLAALDSIMSRSFATHLDVFIRYGKLYIKEANDLGRTEDAARAAMNMQHPLTTFAGEPLTAIMLIDDVLSQKAKIKDSFLLGGLFLKRGRAYSTVNLQNAIDDYSTALENFARFDTLHRADAYLFRGQAYSNKGQFVAAQEDFATAYKFYETKKEYQYMIYARQGVINMFSMNGFYSKAKQERDILIAKMTELDLESFLAAEYYNQALDYRKTGKRKMEYESLLLAEKYLEKQTNKSYEAIGIHSLFVSYYCDHLQLDEAKKHLDFLESMIYDYKGNLPAELNYLAARIDYLLAIEENTTALDLAEKKLEMAKQLEFEEEILASYEILGEVNYRLKNFEKSIDNYRAAALLKDSIYTKTAINSLAYYQTLYEIEKKEKDLIEKSTSIQLLEKDNRTAKWAMVFGGIILVFGFILLIIYRNQQYLKQRRDLQEKYSQGLLYSQEVERKRISQNLHDGLGQQLLVIKNSLISKQDSESMKMVDDAIDDLRSITQDIHPLQLQEVGITSAIRNNIKMIDKNFKIFVSSEIDNIDNVFSKEYELNIFRIIQESLNNILKHSEAKATKITIRKMPTSVFISVRDNGIGFDFEEKYKYSTSLGLKTLMERSRFMKGQMKVVSNKENGTLLEFQIPVTS